MTRGCTKKNTLQPTATRRTSEGLTEGFLEVVEAGDLAVIVGIGEAEAALSPARADAPQRRRTGYLRHVHCGPGFPSAGFRIRPGSFAAYRRWPSDLLLFIGGLGFLETEDSVWMLGRRTGF